jgi:hypothetical protein
LGICVVIGGNIELVANVGTREGEACEVEAYKCLSRFVAAKKTSYLNTFCGRVESDC